MHEKMKTDQTAQKKTFVDTPSSIKNDLNPGSGDICTFCYLKVFYLLLARQLIICFPFYPTQTDSSGNVDNILLVKKGK